MSGSPEIRRHREPTELSQLRGRSERLGTEVRDFVRGQVALWQFVPSLALEANKRQRMNPDYATAYVRSALRIHSPAGEIYIDLTTGDFFQPSEGTEVGQEKRAPVPTSTLLSILAATPEVFDAGCLVERLLEEGQSEYTNGENRQSSEAYRQRIRAEFGIPEVNREEVMQVLEESRRTT